MIYLHLRTYVRTYMVGLMLASIRLWCIPGDLGGPRAGDSGDRGLGFGEGRMGVWSGADRIRAGCYTARVGGWMSVFGWLID
jgi:hypothetical protein